MCWPKRTANFCFEKVFRRNHLGQEKKKKNARCLKVPHPLKNHRKISVGDGERASVSESSWGRGFKRKFAEKKREDALGKRKGSKRRGKKPRASRGYTGKPILDLTGRGGGTAHRGGGGKNNINLRGFSSAKLNKKKKVPISITGGFLKSGRERRQIPVLGEGGGKAKHFLSGGWQTDREKKGAPVPQPIEVCRGNIRGKKDRTKRVFRGKETS